MFATYNLLGYARGCSDRLSIHGIHLDSSVTCPAAVPSLSFRDFSCNPIVSIHVVWWWPDHVQALEFWGIRAGFTDSSLPWPCPRHIPLCLLACLDSGLPSLGPGYLSRCHSPHFRKSFCISTTSIDAFEQHCVVTVTERSLPNAFPPPSDTIEVGLNLYCVWGAFAWLSCFNLMMSHSGGED